MKVLLLNQSEEVLDVISWQRAINLLFSGKARRPHGYDQEYEIRTVSGVFRLPTAIVLATYIRIPYKRAAVNKENVLQRDEFTCQYCGKRLTKATGTIDHVLPSSRGGKHEWANVVASCAKCNNKKADNLPSEVGMELKTKPYVPHRNIIVLQGVDDNTRVTWTRWVEV